MNQDNRQLPEADQHPLIPAQGGAPDDPATRIESSKAELLSVVDRLSVIVDGLIEHVEARREQS